MLSNREVRIKINKIKTSSTLTMDEKRLALAMLKKEYYQSKINDTGFSPKENKLKEQDLKKIKNKAIELGLPELVAEHYSLSQLKDYIQYKEGLRTDYDESELA